MYSVKIKVNYTVIILYWTDFVTRSILGCKLSKLAATLYSHNARIKCKTSHFFVN